jgi:hypothetical protein
MEAEHPKTKLQASLYLYAAKGHMLNKASLGIDYNDRKAGQLCEFLSDLLVAEAQLESWMADLGTNGCQGDNTCQNTK